MINKKTHRGYFVILTLVYSAVFFTLISALAGYIFVEKRAQLAKENREKALHVAEAGLEYYRWFLAHYPDDLQNGTGSAGPYVHTVPDPEGGTLGTFSLDIEGDIFCGSVSSVVITSTGWTTVAPNYRRVVQARYTRPSVAEYSHIVDANVWAGDDRVIHGPYHSNNGVRMDGVHNATVSSGVDSWSCTSSFGCSGTQTVDGVFGDGSNPELWQFPVPPVDFNGITVNLSQLKNFATSTGVYLGPSGNYGYRVELLSNGSIRTRRVTSAARVWEYSTEGGWNQERRVVSNTSSATTHTVPADCPVVFVEDNVWISGDVSGKIIIASADITNPGVSRSVTIEDDISYANASGDGLTLIGEENVLIGLDTPNTLDIAGVFIAQNGHFGRNHYDTAYLSSSLDQYVTRSTLNTVGTVVSRGRVGTKWTSGGTFVSGYSQRNDSFDRSLAETPPPFTPETSDDYTFRAWQEVN